MVNKIDITTNSSLNHLDEKSLKDGVKSSLNQLGEKTTIVSLNHLGKVQSENGCRSKVSLNHLGKVQSENGCRSKELNPSLNHLENKSKKSLNKPDHKYLNHLDENEEPSLNHLGQKQPFTETKDSKPYLNQLDINKKPSLNDIDHKPSAKPSLNHLVQKQLSAVTNESKPYLNQLDINKKPYLNDIDHKPSVIKKQNSLNNRHVETKNTGDSEKDRTNTPKKQQKEQEDMKNLSSGFSNSSTSHSEDDYDTNSESKQEDEEDRFKYFSNEFYTILYANVDQSLTGKINELLGYVDIHKPSIIMLTEIEPKAKKDMTKQIKDSEISIPNYSLFTNDNRKRGVAMYVDSKLNPRECTQKINKKFEECVFCEFEGALNEKTLLGCMYCLQYL